jgi:hypothetical protein
MQLIDSKLLIDGFKIGKVKLIGTFSWLKYTHSILNWLNWVRIVRRTDGYITASSIDVEKNHHVPITEIMIEFDVGLEYFYTDSSKTANVAENSRLLRKSGKLKKKLQRRLS